MAAHKLTGIRQVLAYLKDKRADLAFRDLGPALVLDCWTADIPIDDYLALRDIVEEEDADELYTFCNLVIDRYLEEWNQFDCPATREQWNAARYPMEARSE